MAEPRPAPFFIADHLALDFLNSVAAPSGVEYDWIASGSDLIGWLQAAHAAPAEVLTRYRAQSGSRSLDAVADRARELRDWFRGFVAHHAGKAPAARALRDLKPLNELLADDQIHWQVTAQSGDHQSGDHQSGENHSTRDPNRALRWQAMRLWQDPKSLLLPIAEAIGRLVCEEDFSLVRKCEAPACTLWFLDVSKAHGRRWCSMALCGNRAKAAAHRARSRKQT